MNECLTTTRAYTTSWCTLSINCHLTAHTLPTFDLPLRPPSHCLMQLRRGPRLIKATACTIHFPYIFPLLPTLHHFRSKLPHILTIPVTPKGVCACWTQVGLNEMVKRDLVWYTKCDPHVPILQYLACSIICLPLKRMLNWHFLQAVIEEPCADAAASKAKV